MIFGNFIPISLLVTIETVKFFQAYRIQVSKEMVGNGTQCSVQSSNLNEELGQIDYIFTDKTGTLTQNEMIFKKLIVGNKIFPSENPPKKIMKCQQSLSDKNIPFVEFEDEDFVNSIPTNDHIFKAL